MFPYTRSRVLVAYNINEKKEDFCVTIKDVLILFSRGKDSFLSTLIILNKEYRVNLVIFDNGQKLKSKNILIGAKKIKNKFGEDK